MRRHLALVLLMSLVIVGQAQIFDLNKLDSAAFQRYIATKEAIVVGEMHGTEQVPLFVVNLIKSLKSSQKEITLSLEIPTNYQADVDRFWKTGNFDKLLEIDYFKYPDGRTSVAMGRLIREARDIKGLTVVCFDIDSRLGQDLNRDSVMGVNLSRSYKGVQMVVLTGNLHANLKEGYWRPGFKSATWHFNKLSQLDGKLISLNTYFGSGTIWNCQQDGCRQREANSNRNARPDGTPENFIGIYGDGHASGYTGYVYFDKVTASKPLIN